MKPPPSCFSPPEADRSLRLLDAVPAAFRFQATDLFIEVARRGAYTPEAVLRVVEHELELLVHSRIKDPERQDSLMRLRLEIGFQRDAALDLALFAVWLCSCPTDDRAARTLEGSVVAFGPHLLALPPSSEQCGLLEALGYSGVPPADRSGAARLILSLIDESDSHVNV